MRSVIVYPPPAPNLAGVFKECAMPTGKEAAVLRPKGTHEPSLLWSLPVEQETVEETHLKFIASLDGSVKHRYERPNGCNAGEEEEEEKEMLLLGSNGP